MAKRSGASSAANPRPVDKADVARLLDAMPPHAIEAEISLLGSLLVNPAVVGDVVQVIHSPDDFFRPIHRTIYATIIELYERNPSIDIVQLSQLLKDRGVLEEIGGIDYLVALAEGVPSAAHAMEFAKAVRDKATLRELIDAASEIVHDAHRAGEDAPAVLEAAEQRVFSIAQKRETGGVADMRQLLEQTLKMIEESEGRSLTGLPTGYAELDDLTCGLQAGEMVVIAARPSMGKTALALNLMEKVAAAGHPVAMFSLEMGRQALVQRILCARAGVDSQRLRRGSLRSEDLQRLSRAAESLQACAIYIDDTPALSVLGLRSRARRLREKFGIEAVFVDYLQLMTSGRRSESRQVEVSDISRGIKALAREISAPVICMAQLNRATEDRREHRPRLSDLRESGSIEQDADVVMLLHREEYYHLAEPDWLDANPDKAGLAELIVGKQRNGPTGTIKLSWNSASTSFQDMSSSITTPSVSYGADAVRAPSINWGSRSAPGDDDDLPV
ncbi:MAG: replicative DNA helicase [Phycisphaerales bacterium]|nr:replicative DNA helicase [Phycisphaerales bacterium]